MALDEDTLKLLLAHIDSYIDASIIRQFDGHNQKFTKEIEDRMLLIISRNINEAFVTYQYKLTDSDIENIAARIKAQIDLEFSEKEKILLDKMALFDAEKLEQIQVKVQDNMNLQYRGLEVNNQNVDLNEVLLAILKSDKLISLIDGKLKPLHEGLKKHDYKIDEIFALIASLKLDIEEKFKKVSLIDVQQSDLSASIAAVRLESAERIKQLSAELDGKFASLSDSHYSSIHESVKTSLLNIFGFSANDNLRDMSNESIMNWISSIFVAKADLEERLKSLETNGERAFQLQLDKNAGILMAEINEEIKKQVTVAMAASMEDSKINLGAAYAGLSEEEVIKIVKNVLAVYDADKTGLVDFALETAGGQVISTR